MEYTMTTQQPVWVTQEDGTSIYTLGDRVMGRLSQADDLWVTEIPLMKTGKVRFTKDEWLTEAAARNFVEQNAAMKLENERLRAGL